MGVVADKYDETYRDYIVNGVPASGAHNPKKSDIRAIGGLLEKTIASAGSSIQRFATLEERDNAVTPPPGTLVYVYRNGGSPDDPANGFYQVTGGGYERADWFEQALSPALLDIVLTSSGKNKFDPNAVEVGREISADNGSVVVRADSEVSGIIDVEGGEDVTVSGVPAGIFDRQYVFYRADGVSIVQRGFVAPDTPMFTLAVPTGASRFRFDLSRRNGTGKDYSGVQVELGEVATAFEEFYGDLILGFNGAGIARPGVPASIAELLPVELGTDGVNKFDPEGVQVGYELFSETGEPIVSETSAISPLIEVDGWEGVAVSRLRPTTFDRPYAWVAADRETVISFDFVDKAAASFARARPSGASFFRFDVYRRDTDYGAFDDIQVERGLSVSPFQPYALNTIVRMGGRKFAVEVESPKYQGRVVIVVGDSNSEKIPGLGASSSGEDFNYTNGTRPNWEDEYVAATKPAAMYVTADAGAAFGGWTGADYLQRFQNQVTKAIQAADTIGLDPDDIIIAIGTNDFGNAQAPLDGYGGLGDFATAINKPLSFNVDGSYTTTLQENVSLESMRLGIMRLRFRFPSANILYATALQRGDFSAASMEPWIDQTIRMAGALGCHVADCFRHSGIVGALNGGTATGAISGTTLTLSASNVTLPVSVGQYVKGAGVQPGTRITALLGGMSYTVNISQSVPSTALKILGGIDMPDVDAIHPGTSPSGRRKHASLIIDVAKRFFVRAP